MLEPVIEAIRESSGFEEAKAKIMAAYADMDDEQVTELLAQALFGADAWGRINAGR
jgi:phage gp29-like protein